MKLIFLVYSILSIPYFGSAQTTGIKFESGFSWSQVLAQAKAADKYVFVDCYTTWCGPCKYMAQNIFPLDTVGQYMNAHFVSVSIQMDKTPKDSGYVVAWRATADSLAKTYVVTAYPTYLFFAPDGHVVHRIVGAVRDPQKFISRVSDALDTSKQYYTVIGQYPQHLGDSSFLRKALKTALSLDDRITENQIADAYIVALQNPYNKETLNLLRAAVRTDKGPAFRVFLEHPAEVDTVFHADVANEVVLSLVYQCEVESQVMSGQPVDWPLLSAGVDRLYPTVAQQAILNGKIQYYKDRKEERLFDAALSRYMDLFGDRLGVYELNERAWSVFHISHNKRLLSRALGWSKRALASFPNVDWEYIDTYSNLLYKTGQKEDAIEWEKKAIGLAKIPARERAFEQTLQKMQEGKKTWE